MTFAPPQSEVLSAASSKFSINIITERCKECGICILVCPTKVLEKGPEPNSRGFRYPIPSRVDRCIGCRLCEVNCPDFVIFVTKVAT